MQASGPGAFLKMISGTKWTPACRCGAPRSGTGTAGVGHWRARAGVPGAKGDRRRLSAAVDGGEGRGREELATLQVEAVAMCTARFARVLLLQRRRCHHCCNHSGAVREKVLDAACSVR